MESQYLLYDQPPLDLQTGSLARVKVLVGGHSPELAWVHGPGCIPIAKKTGLIWPLGKWVLEQTCWQYQQWLAARLILPNIAVNLSARQLSQPTLIAKSDRILDRTDMKPKYLGLEITEKAMMLNVDITYNLLSQLSKRGMGIYVEDFGTGYAAFNNLKNFPVK
ncbi:MULTISPECIES: EAL domain-containing protein [unclassified Microcoleus]|uniref:EAL domain-containing protein n=1 Tax=unclassified Microcoleus TaxID=2642155 RepID=UPI002FD06D0B